MRINGESRNLLFFLIRGIRDFRHASSKLSTVAHSKKKILFRKNEEKRKEKKKYIVQVYVTPSSPKSFAVPGKWRGSLVH